MNVKTISRNVGYALLVSALFMLMSVGVSLLNGGDSALTALLVSFLITFIVGVFPFIFIRSGSSISLKEGYTVIVLSWLLSFIFGMLPYALWGGPFSLQNAWFESVSGFTTTGATILENVEALPPSLLFWRSSTHFIGGLGVVVFLLLIIPSASPVRFRLTNLELSSLSKSGYSSSSNKTVYIFSGVYIGICAIAFVSYLLAGMSPLDAICHAFSVCATGGFSTKNLSIAAFGSPLIEGLTMLFMFVASIHFGLIFLSIIHFSLKPLNNPVLKFYVASLSLFSVLSALSLKVNGVIDTFPKALWTGAFQTISAASTTGFAIADNSGWPLSTNLLIIFMAFMCGCAGSTTGGVKADRILVLFKSLFRQLERIVHPSSVNEVKMGQKLLKDESLSPQLLYICIYCVLLAFSVLAALGLGVNPHSAFAGSITSLGNVGPAIAEIGNMGNFNSISAGAKLLFSFDMFLGRVEIFPVFAVLAMLFDSGKN
ncbi:MAG: TrkH family potassium uptake protein [Bacteroidales bacterium]|nr:TrkH family potassium uptake protein [Bacteroidales bacterium]